MSEWCEVARSTYATFFLDDRNDIIFNMPDDPLQSFQLHTGISTRKCMNLCDEHNFSQLGGHRIAYTYTMALQDLMLQCGSIFIGDLCIGQYAKAGIDTINR